jgi:hypothetical protein
LPSFIDYHAINAQHGTPGLISLPKEVVLCIFIALKNPSNSAGSEPANLGSNGKHNAGFPEMEIHNDILITIKNG